MGFFPQIRKPFSHIYYLECVVNPLLNAWHAFRRGDVAKWGECLANVQLAPWEGGGAHPPHDRAGEGEQGIEGGDGEDEEGKISTVRFPIIPTDWAGSFEEGPAFFVSMFFPLVYVWGAFLFYFWPVFMLDRSSDHFFIFHGMEYFHAWACLVISFFV